jgi:hypothetical protein
MRIKTILIITILFPLSLLAQETYTVPIRSDNEPVAPGKFEPTWQSLSQYQVPARGKFSVKGLLPRLKIQSMHKDSTKVKSNFQQKISVSIRMGRFCT